MPDALDPHTHVTPARLQRDLAEELADAAADLFAWVYQRGTVEGLGPQFDEILGRVYGKARLLVAMRCVLAHHDGDGA